VGIAGICIKKGDAMIIGPFKGNQFVNAKIRSIHNDYRQSVDALAINSKGCLCLKIDDKYKPYLRTGRIVSHSLIDINSTKKFQAYVAIFCGKSSNIKAGFNSYINIGIVRSGVILHTLHNPDTNEIIENMIPASKILVDMEFMTHYNCINIGDKFLFISGRNQGI
jgi:GTPase